MGDSLLYYPYIDVPRNGWTIKSLLYWDSVGIIVPQQYFLQPERYSSYTRDLLQTDLIQQIEPYEYVNQLPNFDQGFIELIDSRRHFLTATRKSYTIGRKTSIHVRKFGEGLLNYLIDINIARRIDHEWYEVETATASKIMLYLATVIAKVGDFTPSTDHVARLPGGEFRNRAIIRNKLLNNLIPYPVNPNLAVLRRFKDKYHDELKSFRIQLEQTALEISQTADLDIVNERIMLKVSEIRDRKDKINRDLGDWKVGKIVFGTVCGIGAAALAFSAGSPFTGALAIINAVYTGLEGYGNQSIRERDYAYLALVDRKFERL